MHMKPHTLKKTLSVLKVTLDLNFVLPLQTNRATHLDLTAECFYFDENAINLIGSFFHVRTFRIQIIN